MKHYWVLATRPWAIKLYDDTLRWLPGYWRLIREHDGLAGFQHAMEHDLRKPDLTFVLHWHWIIPADYVNSWPCIGFHSSPLPEFRGGSPIQNQLKRGITESALTAFRLTSELDKGPIVAQAPLSLAGKPDEVFDRIAGIVARMMPRLIHGGYVERPQVGAGSYYSRADAEGFVWA